MKRQILLPPGTSMAQLVEIVKMYPFQLVELLLCDHLRTGFRRVSFQQFPKLHDLQQILDAVRLRRIDQLTGQQDLAVFRLALLQKTPSALRDDPTLVLNLLHQALFFQSEKRPPDVGRRNVHHAA